MQAKCPACNTLLNIPDHLAGKPVKCQCGKVFKCSAPKKRPAVTQPAKQPAAKKSFRITCPKCNKALNVEEKLLGQMVQCPCGTKLQTKAAGSSNTSPQKSVEPTVIAQKTHLDFQTAENFALQADSPWQQTHDTSPNFSTDGFYGHDSTPVSGGPLPSKRNYISSNNSTRDIPTGKVAALTFLAAVMLFPFGLMVAAALNVSEGQDVTDLSQRDWILIAVEAALGSAIMAVGFTTTIFVVTTACVENPGLLGTMGSVVIGILLVAVLLLFASGGGPRSPTKTHIGVSPRGPVIIHEFED